MVGRAVEDHCAAFVSFFHGYSAAAEVDPNLPTAGLDTQGVGGAAAGHRERLLLFGVLEAVQQLDNSANLLSVGYVFCV